MINTEKLCETCKFRDRDGHCTNGKLADEIPWTKEDDQLVCESDKSSGFWVGPKFGCVHHVIECAPLSRAQRLEILNREIAALTAEDKA